MTEHRSALFPYKAVARVTPRSGRPVWRTRYLASCSCGWSADAPDYIAAATGWRTHRQAALARFAVLDGQAKEGT